LPALITPERRPEYEANRALSTSNRAGSVRRYECGSVPARARQRPSSTEESLIPVPAAKNSGDDTDGIGAPAAGRRPMALSATRFRLAAVSRRGRAWVDRQDPGSPSGVAINAWRRYRAVDGPLQSALLSLYVLVAVLPALLVMEEYLDPHP